MEYVLKYVRPDGKKGQEIGHRKEPLEELKKLLLENGFLRASIKKKRI